MNADAITIEAFGKTYVVGRVALARTTRLEFVSDGRLVAHSADGSFRSFYPRVPGPGTRHVKASAAR